jgi:hypothetical protein
MALAAEGDWLNVVRHCLQAGHSGLRNLQGWYSNIYGRDRGCRVRIDQDPAVMLRRDCARTCPHP